MIKNKRQYKYTLSKLNEFKKDLDQIKEQYKDDEQGLKLFTQGYIEHIAQLQDDVYRYEKMKNNPLPQEFIIRSIDEINKYLVWLRLGRNITQTRLAKLIRCKQSDISRFERDNYNKFSLYTLKKILDALGSKIEIRFINEKSKPLTVEDFYLKNDTDNELKIAPGKYQPFPDSKESNVPDKNEKLTPLRA
jgi:transcriptional regulator with XRE-family HTH domain